MFYLPTANAAFLRRLIKHITLLIAMTVVCCDSHATLPSPERNHIWWMPFFAGNRTFDHGALLLEAKIDGVECLVQLDTGANYKFRAGGRVSSNEASRTVTLEINGLKERISVPEGFAQEIRRGEDLLPAGSVGNALFEHGTLVLQLADKRFEYIASPILRDDAEAVAFDYVTPAGWEGGYVILRFSLSDRREQRAMLDTGSAIFGLVPISKSAFESLAKDDKHEFDAPSNTRSVHCTTATLNTDVRIGNIVLHNNVIGYCKNNIAFLGLNITAILGMDRFRSGTLIIDYRSQKWKFTDEKK